MIGNMSDIDLFRQYARQPDPTIDEMLLGDKAYVGHPSFLTPFKKLRRDNKTFPVTLQQLSFNEFQSFHRVSVEHAVARLKVWDIISDVYRGKVRCSIAIDVYKIHMIDLLTAHSQAYISIVIIWFI